MKRARPRFWLLLLLALCGALSVYCQARPTDMPTLPSVTLTAEPAPPASPTSTLTAPSATPPAEVDVRSWALLSRARVDSVQKVFAKVTEEGQGITGAEVHVVAHFDTGSRRYPEEGFVATDETGLAAVSFSVAEARPQETVQVDVFVTYGGATYRAEASFAANC